METTNMKDRVIKALDGLVWPPRVNGFQLVLYEEQDGVRQYSMTIPRQPGIIREGKKRVSVNNFRLKIVKLIHPVLSEDSEAKVVLRDRRVKSKLKLKAAAPVVEHLITVLKGNSSAPPPNPY